MLFAREGIEVVQTRGTDESQRVDNDAWDPEIPSPFAAAPEYGTKAWQAALGRGARTKTGVGGHVDAIDFVEPRARRKRRCTFCSELGYLSRAGGIAGTRAVTSQAALP